MIAHKDFRLNLDRSKLATLLAAGEP